LDHFSKCVIRLPPGPPPVLAGSGDLSSGESRLRRSEPDRHAQDPTAGARVEDESVLFILEVHVELTVAESENGARADLVADRAEELPGEVGADAEAADVAVT